MFKYFKFSELPDNIKNEIFSAYPELKKFADNNGDFKLREGNVDIIDLLNNKLNISDIGGAFKEMLKTPNLKNEKQLEYIKTILDSLFGWDDQQKPATTNQPDLNQKKVAQQDLEVEDNINHTQINQEADKKIINMYGNYRCQALPLSDDSGISISIPLYSAECSKISVSTKEESDVSGIMFLIETENMHITDPGQRSLLGNSVFNFADQIFFELSDLNSFDFDEAYSIKSETMFTFILPFKKQKKPVFIQVF